MATLNSSAAGSRRLLSMIAVLMVGLLAVPLDVQSKSSGDWLLRVGAGKFHPKGTNGAFDSPYAPGTEIEVDVESAPAGRFDVTRMLTERWAIGLLMTTPAKHQIKFEHGAVRQGLGLVGETKRVTLGASAQYHFEVTGRFQPYLGAGLQYTFFFDGEPTDLLGRESLEFEDGFGPTVQVGLDVFLNDRFFINVAITYLWMRPDLHIGDEKISKTEPFGYLWGLHVGYRF